jgi:hypothetical protein
MESLNDSPDFPDALLVRDAMDRASDQLPPLPDLVPGALVQGRQRRRRFRARLAAAGGALSVAALVTAGALVLPSAGTGPLRQEAAAMPSGHASGGSTSYPVVPARTPWPGPGPMAELPPVERARLEAFQQWAADVFQDLLPSAIGGIQIVGDRVSGFQGVAGGKTFPITFSVRPAAETPTWNCANGRAAKPGVICEEGVLPDGTPVSVRTAPTRSMDAMDAMAMTGASAVFRYGGSAVLLDIGPDDAHRTSAPVSTSELLAIVTHDRFIQLVKYADTDMVLKKQNLLADEQAAEAADQPSPNLTNRPKPANP